MKTNYRTSFFSMALLGTLVITESASAFYDANLGRWINRDPYGDTGTPVLRNVRRSTLRTQPWESYYDRNLYAFVKNTTPNAIDPLGLKCVLLSNGMVADTDKGEIVFWSSDPNKTAQFIADCNFKKRLPVIGFCLILFGGGPSVPKVETCGVTYEGEGVCVYTCPSGAIHVEVAGPLGCVDPRNYPVE